MSIVDAAARRSARAAYMREYRRHNLHQMRASERERSRWPENRARKLAYMKRYRAENADRIRATKRWCYERKRDTYLQKSRERSQTNATRYAAQKKRWAAVNAVRKKESDRAWYEANKERHLQQSRNWAQANRAKRLKAVRRYHQCHPEQVKLNTLRRRSRIEQARGEVTPGQIRDRVAFYGNRCAYCGGPYEHIDHVIPLSRGGSNWPANLRPSCRRCNLAKGAKLPHQFASWSS